MRLSNVMKGALGGVLMFAAGVASAEYPEKKIELIVGYSAGGGTDVMARTVAPFLEKHLGGGASIVVKNVPGASGQIGLAEVANAKSDGYTLGTYNLPGAMARTIGNEAAYSADSFTYLANVVSDPTVFVTSKNGDIESLQELIERAKAAPGAITVGLPSLGGPAHFLLLQLQEKAGVEFTIVPFRGSAPARVAVMGGHVAISMPSVSEAVGYDDEVKIFAIAADEPSEYAPDVPTLASSGYDLRAASMRGFVGPAGLPDDVREKLLGALEDTFSDPEFANAMRKVSNPISLTLGDDFRVLNSEILETAREMWAVSPWK